MPDPTIEERDVSNYWLDNYNPVLDTAMTGVYDYYDANGFLRYGDFIMMDDGVGFFDHDRDGWWDVARRVDSSGNLEEFNGRDWRDLGPAGGLHEEPESGSHAMTLHSDWLMG